jgi:hypothetical protein
MRGKDEREAHGEGRRKMAAFEQECWKNGQTFHFREYANCMTSLLKVELEIWEVAFFFTRW